MIYVAYEDDGPIGPTGQTCDITSPWRRLYRFDDRDRAGAFIEGVHDGKMRRRRARIIGAWSDDEHDGYPAVVDLLGREARDDDD